MNFKTNFSLYVLFIEYKFVRNFFKKNFFQNDFDICFDWEFEFLIDENIEFNEKDSDLRNKFDKFQNFEIFKFHNNLNIARIDVIIDALKCVWIILQFDCFMNLYIYWMIVNENAMKINVFNFEKIDFLIRQKSQIKVIKDIFL